MYMDYVTLTTTLQSSDYYQLYIYIYIYINKKTEAQGD